MASYEEVTTDVLELGHQTVLTSKEQFEELKESHRYGFKVPLDVIARCGHKIDGVSLYQLNTYKNAMCDRCEDKDFDSLYNEVVKRFEALGTRVLTTKDEFIMNQMTLNDPFRLQMTNCPHERTTRYFDIRDVPKDKIFCASCARKKKNNGNLNYEDVLEKFKKIGCELLTTKEEYEENNMSRTCIHRFRASCGHTVEKKPCEIEFRRKTPLRCPDC